MSATVKWRHLFPNSWKFIPSKRLFPESTLRAGPDDEQLTASQEWGVIPQKEFVRRAGRRVVELNQHLDMRKRVERDDFVISMRSFQGGLERAWAEGGIRSSYVVLKPSSEVDVGYFARLFKCEQYIRALQATALFIRDGQDLNYQNFCLVDLPLPPKHEQIQIARFLDYETARIDALIDKQQQLIALLKEKRQAVISHAVTKGLNPNTPLRDSGVEWLGMIPVNWVVLNLNRVVDTFVDYRGRTPEKIDEGRPLLTAGAIKNGVVAFDRSPQFVSEATYRLLRQRGVPEPEDILFTSEAPLGEVALVEDVEVACAQRIIMFKVNRRRIVPRYLWLYLRSQAGRDEILTKASGSTAEGIRADRLRRARVPLPPVDEQQRICDHVRAALDGFDEILAATAAQTALLQERRTALISAAVTGKIDVRNWAPPKSDAEQDVA